MSIAMVDQNLVDAHIQRTNHFVDNVHKFQEKLNAMLQAVPTVTEQATVQASAPNIEPMQNVQPATTTVTADDIDIDAILNGIDLGDSMSM